MAPRRLVSPSARESVLGIPSDIVSLERCYSLPDDDLALIETRRRPENRLGLALHLALLRHPGQGWPDGMDPPPALVAWLVDQATARPGALGAYAVRGATRSAHRAMAIRHLGLLPFAPAEHMQAALRLAADAAFDTVTALSSCCV